MSTAAIAIRQTVINLSRASGPDRILDAEIAFILGWRSDSSNSETCNDPDKKLWRNPDGELCSIPKFTSNLDIAMGVVEQFSTILEGGFGWEVNQGSAKFGLSKALAASTPVLAVCIQGLLLRLRQLEAARN